MTDDRNQLSKRMALEKFDEALQACDADEAEARARSSYENDPTIRGEFRSLESCLAYSRALARGLTRARRA